MHQEFDYAQQNFLMNPAFDYLSEKVLALKLVSAPCFQHVICLFFIIRRLDDRGGNGLTC